MSRRTAGEPLTLGRGDARRIFGLEHEYRVLEDARQIDFRAVLHDLRAEGLRLDPTDPNAYRCAWGGLLTADGPEAEVAIAPVPLVAGCTHEVERRAVEAHGQLARLLPERFRLDGYSTHLNVELDERSVVKAARLFSVHYSPAMMLLLDKATSPGLLVRPRSSRLEIGGEHSTGAHLRAATTFATAGALACGSAARSRRARPQLPTAVRGEIRPAKIRTGWYVDRSAFGDDLYQHARATVLHDRRGHRRTAEEQLIETWQLTRPFAADVFDATELDLVDRIVDGRAPLPVEDARFDEPVVDARMHDAEPSPFERVNRTIRRPGFAIEPRSIAWNAVVFDIRVEQGERRAVACIPRRVLHDFFDDLDAGRLDTTIVAFLASPPADRMLVDSTQADEPRLFDGIGRADAIVPPEHGGRGLARLGGGGGTPADSRRDKHRRRPPRHGRLLIGAAVAVAAVAIAGVAVAARSNTHDTQTVSAATVTTVPIAQQPNAPEQSTSESDSGPLTVDPCSLLSDGDVEAFAETMAGTYRPQPPLVASPTGVTNQPVDPAKKRFCTWHFQELKADGSTGDGDVDIVVEKVDKRHLDSACRLVPANGPPRVFDGVGDHAEATPDTGCVVVGDVKVNILYGGLTEDAPSDSGVIAHVLAVIAAELGSTAPPPSTTPDTDPAPPVSPTATTVVRTKPSDGGSTGSGGGIAPLSTPVGEG